MNPLAIDHAKIRLAKAEIAYNNLRTATELAEQRSAWSDFLIASAGIYSKLKEGAKGNGKSQAWYGRMANFRKNDSVLSYIHQARNTEEHGLQEIVHDDESAWGISGTGHYVITMSDEPIPKSGINIQHLGGEAPRVVEIRRLSLTAVRDERFGDTFNVPSSIIGMYDPLEPWQVAHDALLHLGRLIEEAETYV